MNNPLILSRQFFNLPTNRQNYDIFTFKFDKSLVQGRGCHTLSAKSLTGPMLAYFLHNTTAIGTNNKIHFEKKRFANRWLLCGRWNLTNLDVCITYCRQTSGFTNVIMQVDFNSHIQAINWTHRTPFTDTFMRKQASTIWLIFHTRQL